MADHLAAGALVVAGAHWVTPLGPMKVCGRDVHTWVGRNCSVGGRVQWYGPEERYRSAQTCLGRGRLAEDK